MASSIALHNLDSKASYVSNAAEAEYLGMDRKQTRAMRQASADVSFHLERAWWRKLESDIAQPRDDVRLVAYVDYGCYDGVDLKVVTNNVWKSVQRHAPGANGAAEGDLQLAKELREELLGKKEADDAYGYAKIQHGVNLVGMAFMVKDQTVFWSVP